MFAHLFDNHGRRAPRKTMTLVDERSGPRRRPRHDPLPRLRYYV